MKQKKHVNKGAKNKIFANRKIFLIKKTLGIFLIVAMVITMLPQMSIRARAANDDQVANVDLRRHLYNATFEDINNPSVFLKQAKGSVTCTLVAAVMMMRRTAMATGNANWSSITESSARGTAWKEGAGLYNSFKYAGIQVRSGSLNNSTSNVINLLKAHPEGIVIYNTSKPHAILLTDYTNGVFYCADPSSYYPTGRIPISQASITLSSCTKYWYVESPQVNLNVDHEPQGALDYCESSPGYIRVAGWAVDYDTPQQSLWIHVYCDDTYLGAIQADGYRSDIAEAFSNINAGAYHGYDANIPINMYGTHTIKVFALNNLSTGNNPLLGSKSIDILPAGSEMPYGFDRALPDGDYIIANAGTTDKSSYFYFLDFPGTDVPVAQGTYVSLCGPTNEVGSYDIWSIKYSDGFYSIVQKGTTQALDVQDASLSDDAKVMSYPSHGGDNQKWAISSNGRNGYRIQAKHSGLSLAAGQTNTNSAAVTTKISVDDDTQSWMFIPYQPKKTVSNGKYIIVSDLNSNYIMDVLGNTGDVADLTGVKLGKNTSNNKFNSFEIKALDNGYYSIVNSASGKSLDLSSANSNINNSIVVNKVNSSSFSQQWAIEKNGNGYTIKSKCSGMPLGINNSAVSDGATISQNVFTGGKEQTWKLVKAEYTVKYDLNGGTGTIKNQTKYYKNALTLSKTEPTRENYNFLGWASSKDATTPEYKAGDTYKTDKNVTLYAVWAEKTLYKIKFSGGTNATGTAPSTIKAESGKKIVLPENPFKRTCYKFIGWSDGKKTYSAGSKYTVPSKSVTLTAEWEYVPSNVPKASDSNIKAPLSVTSFIKRCYKVALGREADPTGLQYWVDKLNGNQYTGAQIGYGFIFSDEYKAKHTSNNQFIRDLYAMYFDREPDAVGYNYWMGQLKSGVGREEVFAGFANSDEFFNLCAGYEIAGGVYVTGYNLDAQGKINCYVARLYKVCFNRLPDKAGQTYWVEQLINGKETGTTVAENMIFSTEFKNLKLNDKNYIAYLYRSIFGREPGKDEFNYWLKRLVDKAETRESIFYEFTDSVEFKNMCNSYGINP